MVGFSVISFSLTVEFTRRNVLSDEMEAVLGYVAVV